MQNDFFLLKELKQLHLSLSVFDFQAEVVCKAVWSDFKFYMVITVYSKCYKT